MSYIRALSNPEKLYIIGNGRGQVEIYASLPRPYVMPRHVFHGLFLRWLEYFDDDCRYRGARLYESHDDWRWVLTYKDWPKGISLRAYEVTWAYIAENVKGRK